ncbi:peptidyl-prolyl cis-trans isomerase FKBP3-like isoform X2 [Stigmatopora argus]
MRQISFLEWTARQPRNVGLPKKDLKFFQHYGAHSFLNEHRLLGNIKNVAKTSKKRAVCRRHNQLFVSKRKTVGEVTKQVKAVIDEMTKEVKEEVVDEVHPSLPNGQDKLPQKG